jgi:predicted metalloprotease with PDZ domain
MKYMYSRFALSMLISTALSANLAFSLPDGGPTVLSVDASDAPRGIFNAQLHIPAAPGPLTLCYPKWIPGEHSPSGPITQLAGLKFSVNGKAISWERDKRDMFMFRCTVPPEGNGVDIELTYLSPGQSFYTGYGNSPNATAHLCDVLWNHLLLYPAGRRTDDQIYKARLRLPEGWKYATALPVASARGSEIEFSPVSLTTLVDSPVIAGEYFRSIPLSSTTPSGLQLDIVADDQKSLGIDSLLVAHYGNLEKETDALFGVRHYQRYHIMVSLSDLLLSNGVEHHECTDIREPANMFTSRASTTRRSYILVHEFLHSWNGKYRRPAGLATADYQEPMEGDMLWVYEGLTKYLDFVLTARTQVRTIEESREFLAWIAALEDESRPGRSWRSLNDVQVSAQLTYTTPAEWVASRRDAMDFYYEGLLLWLDVDATIREKSGGKHSLDDFCRTFFGRTFDTEKVRTYVLSDVVAALNVLAPLDWSAYFTEKLTSTSPHAPLQGLERCGWTLSYAASPNSFLSAKEEYDSGIDHSFSLGICTDRSGTISDVVPEYPGFKSGLGPTMKIVAVNGRSWTPELLGECLAESRMTGTPIELMINYGGRLTSRKVDYDGGARYPHIRRNGTQPDRLSQILAPRVDH